MVKAVDKFSIENRADEEIKFAVENVIRHDYDNAVNHIKRALGMLKSIGCMEKYVEYLNILGLVYELDNKESAAFDCYLENLANAEIMRSKDLKAMIYSNIASSYSKMGRNKEAQRYFKDACDEYGALSENTEERHRMWGMFEYVNNAINDRYVALS